MRRVIASAGRSFPVELRYLDRPPQDRVEAGVAAAIRRALDEDDGSILVFLPGGAEIRRVERLLGDLGGDIIVAPLYGDLPPAAQDAGDCARRRRAGARSCSRPRSPRPASPSKASASSSMAASLRGPRFDPSSGMTRLVTTRVSQAAVGAARRPRRAARARHRLSAVAGARAGAASALRAAGNPRGRSRAAAADARRLGQQRSGARCPGSIRRLPRRSPRRALY